MTDHKPDTPLVAPDSDVAVFSVDDLPPANAGWRAFRKVATTMMVRIDGPFEVETSEGRLRCEDGWLAIDARGYPYPIAADEQELIYEPLAAERAPGEPENYPEKEPRWKRTPGRCVACGGYAESDDALLCPMCQDQGVDAERIMAIKAGTHPGYLDRLPEIEDLPFDGQRYTLPDGKTAAPADVRQALQNWYDDNISVARPI